jgi:predicted DNA-binding transcriptional regulator AlpA
MSQPASALPSNIPKRGLSLDEAAEYCGVSRNSLLRHGPNPTKIGDRSVYDRRVLDAWLDHLAAAAATRAAPPPAELSAEDMSPLEEAIHARKNSVRHPPRR